MTARRIQAPRLARLFVLLTAAWSGVAGFGSAAGAATSMADRAHRSRVAGIDVVTYPTGVKDVVVLVAVLPAGDAMGGTGNIAVPTLMGMMLDRGTKSLDKFAIADRLDNVGASISFAVGVQSLEVRAKCLRKDLDMVLGLMASELRVPAFQSAEFAKARQQFVGSLQASLQSTDGRAHEAFSRAIFPAGHPNRPHSIDEYLAAAKSVSLDELKAFHARYYGPQHMTLVAVGDVDSAAVEGGVAREFAGWSGGQDYLRPTANPKAGPHEVSVPLAEKPSVSVILGQTTGLSYRDPDSLPLRVGTAILGHGFTGRLMGTVRDKEGLTYNIGAGVVDDTIADGAWEISGSFAPALLDKGIASTRRVLEKWWTDGVTEAELADRKQGILGGYFVGLSTTGGLAGAIVTTLQRGYDLSWLDRYPEAVNALSRTQVNAAIKAHLDPSTMTLIEAGTLKPAASPASPTAE